MASVRWVELNVHEKLEIVTGDIKVLLDEIVLLTNPNGELDSVLDEALESFEPLLEVLNATVEESDSSSEISVESQSTIVLNDDPENDKRKSRYESSPVRIEGFSERVAEEGNVSQTTRKMKSNPIVLVERIETVMKNVPKELRRRDNSVNFSHPGPSGVRKRPTVRRPPSVGSSSSGSVYETLTHTAMQRLRNKSYRGDHGDVRNSSSHIY